MMGLLHLIQENRPYYEINREERNHAAILYHLLATAANLYTFLNLIPHNFPIIEKELAVYFDYAYLRDLWNKTESNAIKRRFILDFVNPSPASINNDTSTFKFNEYFGAIPKPSVKYIQSPATWSISHFNDKILDNDEFIRVCKLKWCFNAKPDIVIHTTNEHTICIEAKLESKEGKYPINGSEIREFKLRNIKRRYTQTAIQQELMNILGIETKIVLLGNKKSSKSEHYFLSWKEVFSGLNTSGSHPFVKKWIKAILTKQSVVN